MTILRAFIKVLLLFLVILTIPFLIELLLNAYEMNRNPWTKNGAIVTSGGGVKKGVNRRAFKEIRFRSTGIHVYFSATELSDAQADALISDVKGTLRILQEGQEQYAYAFKLEENLRKNVGGLDSLENLTGVAVMDIADKIDLECRLVAATPADIATANTFAMRAFAVGEAIELVFEFEGDVPSGSMLRFSYSQCPRSLLHGTFLERIAVRLKRALA